MDIVTNSHGERSFLGLLLLFTFLNFVSCNLAGLSLSDVGTISVMDRKHEVADFVVESNALSRWETGSDLEELFGDNFLAIVEFVGNADWDLVVFFDLELSNLEIWRKHGGLKGTSSGDAVC